MRPQPLIILGAGLAGSLLAVFLARRGFEVTVLERRPDMRRREVPAGRSINLALADRGIHALRAAGVHTAVEPLLIPMRGRMLHALSGELTLVPYGKDDSEVIYSVSRGELNKLLMNAAESVERVRFRFEQSAAAVDFETATLRIHDADSGDQYTLAMNPVIAADGGGSIVRRAMAARPGYANRETLLEHGYKELEIPPARGGGWRLDAHALHIWPRGGYMLIALPNLDGSFTVTLFLPHERFATLAEPAAVERFFAEEFPDAAAEMPDLLQAFFAHPTGEMGTVRCTPWSVGGQVLLIGDAAHAIVPFHGQGMNCAFEDCLELDRLLDEYDTWPALFAEFERRRRPNSEAIADMALENYVEMRDTVRDPRFQLQKALSLELERRFPERFIPRYSMVMFHHEIPYAEAQRRGRVQAEILDALTRRAEPLEEVDLEAARRLIETRLAPIGRVAPAGD